MKTFILATATALLATATAQAATHNPAVKESHVAHAAAPASGANSFTEAQAKGRVEKAGYGNVSALVKDREGVWRGTATRAGKTVDIGLDFKGNVTTR